jgi:hypothetical protein
MSRRDPTLDPATARELEALDAALAGRPVDPELADLAALAAEVRADAPRPTPAFADRLDARVAAGFPRRARPGVTQRRWFAPAAVGSLGAAVLAGVVALALVNAGPNGASDSASVAGGSGSGSGEASVAAPSTASGGSGAGAAADSAAPGAGTRRVERTAELSVSVAADRFDEAAARVPQIAADAGAIVERSAISTGADGGRATFALRVPVGRLQDTLAELSGLGRVAARNETGLDVTGAYVSAADRLGDLVAERASVRRQLAATTVTDDANRLRDRLDALQREISSARATVAQLRERTSYARVSLTLRSRPAETGTGATGGGWSVGDALDDAAGILAAMLSALIVALAIAAPLLALLAAVVLGRGARRRRREQALGPAS